MLAQMDQQEVKSDKDLKEAAEKLANYEEKISQLMGLKETLLNEKDQLANQLASAEQQVELKQGRIDSLEQTLSEAQTTITNNDEKIKTLEDHRQRYESINRDEPIDLTGDDSNLAAPESTSGLDSNQAAAEESSSQNCDQMAPENGSSQSPDYKCSICHENHACNVNLQAELTEKTVKINKLETGKKELMNSLKLEQAKYNTNLEAKVLIEAD